MSTRQVHHIQLASAVADGAVLTTVLLYFTGVVGLGDAAVGQVLAAAAAAAVVLAPPLGVLTDRLGATRAAGAFSGAVGVALAAYTVADALWSYAAAAVLYGVARSGLLATVQAVVAAGTEPSGRVRARGTLHTVLNAGFALGALLGAAVLAIDEPTLFAALFGAGATIAAGCAVAFLRLPAPPGARPRVGRTVAGRSRALRDPRLLTVTGLASVLQLTMPVLSVLLPLWIVRTAAPLWLAAAAFGLNTVLVIGLQPRCAALVRTDRHATLAALGAGSGIALAAVLFAVVPGLPTSAAVALVLVGVVVLTLGEVSAGPAAWHQVLRDVPADRQGEYQAVFGASASIARVMGPLVALPLMTALESAGWVIIGVVVLTAGALLAATGQAPAPAYASGIPVPPQRQYTLASRARKPISTR